MENKTMQFKTNLQCGGCVSKVQADLDEKVGINQWNVDINNADKILTVTSEAISPEEIVDIVKSKGFNIENI